MSPHAAAIATACTDEAAATFEDAKEAAASCDKKIEILDERTAWETSYVLPSGESSLSVSVNPTRTNVNGAWEALDTTISETETQSRMLNVEAPVFDIAINGGDTAATRRPLGTMKNGDHEFKVWFPLALPEPTVDGDTATYELFPGVRIVTYISAAGTGFTPVVELDSPKAAEAFRAALAAARTVQGLPGTAFDIPLSYEVTDGLTASTVEGGALHIVDAAGELIFEAPPAYMWDSSGALPVEPRLATDPNTEPMAGERAEWAWPGDVVAQMPMTVSSNTILISPNTSVLTSSDTEWPVHIDPGFASFGKADWTMLRTGGYTSSMYRFTNLSASYPGGGAGRCVGTTSCGVSYYIGRLVWQFSGMTTIAALNGADVTAAVLHVYGISSNSCTAAATELWHTDGIDSSSTWSTVGFNTINGSRTEAQRDGCTEAPGWRDFNALPAVKYTADGNYTQVTLGLKAADESSMAGWKRFRNDATLNINYNRAPNKVTNLKMSEPAKDCVSGAGRPLITDRTPTFTANVSDPDTSDSPRPSFQVYKVSDGTQVWSSGTLAAVANGQVATTTVGTSLPDEIYGYRVTLTDGSLWSGWDAQGCQFQVDGTPPVAPSITPVTTGVSAVYVTAQERGGVGVPGKFTLNRLTSTDVEKYYYQVTGKSETTVESTAATVVISITPDSAGPKTLEAWTRDKAGHLSPRVTYSFEVASSKATTVWKMDEGTGTTSADASGATPARPLTLTSTTWGDGADKLFGANTTDRALQFNGTSSFASSQTTIDTSKSFAISARVWLNASALTGTAAQHVAVSQNAVNQSSFTLGYERGCSLAGGCWRFAMANTDIAASPVTAVDSSVAVQGNRWVHLVGSYDATTATARKLNVWVCDIGTPTDPGNTDPVTAVPVTRAASDWNVGGQTQIVSTTVENEANATLENEATFLLFR